MAAAEDEEIDGEVATSDELPGFTIRGVVVNRRGGQIGYVYVYEAGAGIGEQGPVYGRPTTMENDQASSIIGAADQVDSDDLSPGELASATNSVLRGAQDEADDDFQPFL